MMKEKSVSIRQIRAIRIPLIDNWNAYGADLADFRGF